MSKLIKYLFAIVFLLPMLSQTALTKDNKISPLVIMSDFGLKDGAVSAMKGVAYSVNNNLPIFDLSHDITPYDIWEGAYRLYQVVNFWEKGTVFVSIVDPGVGTQRTSIVARSKSGHYFVNPNNGLLTLIQDTIGIDELRIIDENKNRLSTSYDSYTFHGRDVYVYTGARLASKTITFEQVGPKLPLNNIEMLTYQKPLLEGNMLKGMIPVLDENYGNVWTNIPKKLFDSLNPKLGDKFNIKIYNNGKRIYSGVVPYQNTFGEVPVGRELLYFNSLMELSLAINENSFANKHKISYGNNWIIEVSPHK